ncbi:hypothetical protein [Ralstonia flaminis]|jgi:hypothetical protein|uniref:Cell wall anchor protein n=1 Tax=Ralstonia flaminis TaxID=3058597 RepID=A0ABM9K2S2_9RALS|nr:hypothetical protein [Ralstonia sp. LMG 18101]CAJ0811066.1 hypothetical protein LMG18101_01111 [Ralstonia sp. LMG 18101]
MQTNSTGRGRHTGTVVLTAAALAVALLVAGCGGSDSSSTSAGGGTTTPASASLTGTAATGSALPNANVAVTDSAGNSPCVETAITTTALGAYTCTLKAGETAPFFVVVTDPTGNTAPLVSVTTVTPPAGSPLTLNATPLTTAIVAQLSPDGNPLTVVNAKTVDATALKTVTANVVAQLASVLSAIGAPANYDPFGTSISAATASSSGNTADQVLDIVKVSKDPSSGQLQLSTVGSTTPPVPLATASGGGSTLPAPAANVSTLTQGVQAMASALTTCFAQPVAQRAVATDTTVPATQGGATVTSFGAACQNIVSDTSNAGGIAFLHNGYNGGQWLYSLLTSSTMTGAQFSVPEIMSFSPAASNASGLDEATVNIKYLDANGNPGNLITMARFITAGASSAHASNWWLVGNQQPVDITAKTVIRRVEQFNPSSGNFSHFRNGVQFLINAAGPGTVINGKGNLSYAIVTGPGLPQAGLVFIPPVVSGQAYMDLANKTGTIPASYQCGNTSTTKTPTYNCPNFWISKTTGISGSAASQLVSANPGGVTWAQSADNLDPTAVTKGVKYTIALFYGSNTNAANPDLTIRKTLLTDLVAATQGVNLPWNTPGSQSLAALDPTNSSLNGPLTSLTVDWVQNVSAQQIGGVAVTIDPAGTTYSPQTAVPKGATSAVISLSNGQQVPALTTSTPRSLNFSYRMLDNSAKSTIYTYN